MFVFLAGLKNCLAFSAQAFPPCLVHCDASVECSPDFAAHHLAGSKRLQPAAGHESASRGRRTTPLREFWPRGPRCWRSSDNVRLFVFSQILLLKVWHLALPVCRRPDWCAVGSSGVHVTAEDDEAHLTVKFKKADGTHVTMHHVKHVWWGSDVQGKSGQTFYHPTSQCNYCNQDRLHKWLDHSEHRLCTLHFVLVHS